MSSHERRRAPLDALEGGLIVSCQAGPESPLNAVGHLVALAKSAELGGPVGFRVDGPDNIRAIRNETALPVLGIRKRHDPASDVYITPTYADAQLVIGAGCDLVALDGTQRTRPDSAPLDEVVERIHDEHGVAVMADIASFEDAKFAAEAGADLLATTLAGYTEYSRGAERPALDLATAIVDELDVPVVVEGGIWTREHVAACFEAGAFAVVVGSAITVPEFITRRLTAATPRGRRRENG